MFHQVCHLYNSSIAAETFLDIYLISSPFDHVSAEYMKQKDEMLPKVH